MKNKWTRRKFLETGLKGSLVVGGAVGGLRPAAAQRPVARPKLPWPGLDARERELLRAAIDELIPAGEGMPRASEVGGVDYLERLARELPEFQRDLESVMTKLQEVSEKRSGKGFSTLSRAKRIEVLEELEVRSAPKLFASLRGAVYEAYYTRPEVWKLIGYELYPTNQPGPHMKPFDESMLVEVRKRPRLYREAR